MKNSNILFSSKPNDIEINLTKIKLHKEIICEKSNDLYVSNILSELTPKTFWADLQITDLKKIFVHVIF